MSFAAACGWSLARSLCVATLGACIAARLSRLLHGSGWTGRTLWGLVLLPVFVPGLLIGYGYRNFSLSLVHQPLWNEVVYAGLTLLLVVPVGTLILLASPPSPLSRPALHVARLLRAKTTGAGGRLSWWKFAAMWIRCRGFAILPAWSAMFLVSFQETEVATLMQAAGWPEWTFTRLATGTELAAMVRPLLLVIVLQLGVIALAAALIVGARGTVSIGPPSEAGALPRACAWGYALLAVTMLLVVPASYVLRGASEGLSVLAAHPRLMQQIGIGMLFGATSGLLAWLAGGAIVEHTRRGMPQILFVPLLLPGLLGAWALGLLLAVLFQQPMLRSLYDSPLPMLLGEFLFQLPRAVLVRLLLGQWRDSSAAHQARLLGRAADPPRRGRSAGLLWRLDGRTRVLGCLIICYWAYMELSIPSPALLGPPGMTTAPVLLYNQMHYGQIPGLSALVLVTLAVPVVCLLAMTLAARFVATRGKS